MSKIRETRHGGIAVDRVFVEVSVPMGKRFPVDDELAPGAVVRVKGDMRVVEGTSQAGFQVVAHSAAVIREPDPAMVADVELIGFVGRVSRFRTDNTAKTVVSVGVRFEKGVKRSEPYWFNVTFFGGMLRARADALKSGMAVRIKGVLSSWPICQSRDRSVWAHGITAKTLKVL